MENVIDILMCLFINCILYILINWCGCFWWMERVFDIPTHCPAMKRERIHFWKVLSYRHPKKVFSNRQPKISFAWTVLYMIALGQYSGAQGCLWLLQLTSEIRYEHLGWGNPTLQSVCMGYIWYPKWLSRGLRLKEDSDGCARTNRTNSTFISFTYDSDARASFMPYVVRA